MAANKKTNILGPSVRGQGTGAYSGTNQDATRPSFGSATNVYAGYARSGGKHVQTGATPEAARNGSK